MIDHVYPVRELCLQFLSQEKKKKRIPSVSGLARHFLICTRTDHLGHAVRICSSQRFLECRATPQSKRVASRDGGVRTGLTARFPSQWASHLTECVPWWHSHLTRGGAQGSLQALPSLLLYRQDLNSRWPQTNWGPYFSPWKVRVIIILPTN